MRKFRFIGNPDYYQVHDKTERTFIVGAVYLEDYIGVGCYYSVGSYAENQPNDWEEVFDTNFVKGKPFTDIPKVETKSKSLHKDTDLGYFAGLAMQGLMTKDHINLHITNLKMVAEMSIVIAKELIKQLDAESK